MAEPDGDLEELMLVDEPEFQHVMECVFGIQSHECRTFLVLIEVPGSTVAELASHLDRDRSSVNRVLATLREKGLVNRERRLLPEGGHVYQYSAVPLPEAKDRMHEAVEQWADQVHTQIDEFGVPADQS